MVSCQDDYLIVIVVVKSVLSPFMGLILPAFSSKQGVFISSPFSYQDLFALPRFLGHYCFFASPLPQVPLPPFSCTSLLNPEFFWNRQIFGIVSFLQPRTLATSLLTDFPGFRFFHSFFPLPPLEAKYRSRLL